MTEASGLFEQIAAEAVQRAIQKCAENAVGDTVRFGVDDRLRELFLQNVKTILATEEMQALLRERLLKAINDLPMTLKSSRY